MPVRIRTPLSNGAAVTRGAFDGSLRDHYTRD